MKKFIILSGSVDGATCEDDGFLNCANFGLVGTRACDTLEEAIEVRDQTIEQDLADAHETWDADEEDSGISFDVGNFGDGPESDKYLDVYYRGNVINETTYKIVEVEF
jgi:hypothetical protein